MKHIFLTVGFFFSCSLLGTAITEDAFFTDLGTFDHDKANHTAGINSVHWLECGGKKYLAIGGGAGDNDFQIRVLRFDNFNGGTLTALPGGGASDTNLNPGGNQIHGEDVNSVQWIDCGVNKLLAIGGVVSNDITTRVYSFDPVDETLVQKSAGLHSNEDGAEVFKVAWLTCNGNKILATAGSISIVNATPESFMVGVKIYKVDPSQLDLNSMEKIVIDNEEMDVNSIAWLDCGNTKYLATGYENNIRVYAYTCSDFDVTTLTMQDENNAFASVGTSDVPNEIAWLICGDKKYLAVALTNGQVQIFEFDIANTMLTSVGTVVVTQGESITSLTWLNCGGTKYLATGDTNNNTKVFRFDPDATEVLIPITSATKVHQTNGNGENVNAVAWLQCGALTFLGMGGNNTGVVENGDTTNRVYQVNFDDDATNELLRNKFFQAHDALTSPGATAGL